MPKIASTTGTFELHWDDQRTAFTLVCQTSDKRTTVLAALPAHELALSHPDLLRALDAAAAGATETSAVDKLALDIMYRMPGRAELGLTYLAPVASALARWVFSSREVTNFTYDLTPRNTRYLAHFLATAFGVDSARVGALFDELAASTELKAHLATYAQQQAISAECDGAARFGRRIAWYAVVRLIKPRLVVETGVDQGMGALVLCEALRRNRLEGADGRYVGLDINPRAGSMLSGVWAGHGALRYGDAIETIGRLDTPVDLYVSDSDHSADYEYREYLAMAPHLSPRAPIIADNAHVTECLCRFAEETGRTFGFFREDPADHFYPGAGLGLSLPR
jgi:predicted O-methyltransferase YrrM